MTALELAVAVHPRSPALVSGSSPARDTTPYSPAPDAPAGGAAPAYPFARHGCGAGECVESSQGLVVLWPPLARGAGCVSVRISPDHAAQERLRVPRRRRRSGVRGTVHSLIDFSRRQTPDTTWARGRAILSVAMRRPKVASPTPDIDPAARRRPAGTPTHAGEDLRRATRSEGTVRTVNAREDR